MAWAGLPREVGLRSPQPTSAGFCDAKCNRPCVPLEAISTNYRVLSYLHHSTSVCGVLQCGFGMWTVRSTYLLRLLAVHDTCMLQMVGGVEPAEYRSICQLDQPRIGSTENYFDSSERKEGGKDKEEKDKRREI